MIGPNVILPVRIRTPHDAWIHTQNKIRLNRAMFHGEGCGRPQMLYYMSNKGGGSEVHTSAVRVPAHGARDPWKMRKVPGDRPVMETACCRIYRFFANR